MIERLGLTLAAASMMAFTAQAVPIDGSVGFAGGYTANGTVNGLNTATTMTIKSVTVIYSDNDLAGANTPTFASPIGVNGNPPAIGQLWSVVVGGNTFVFTVTSQSQTVSQPNLVALAGTGILSDGAGPFDDTPGTWQLSFGKTQAAFTWQATSAANVPDGGATLILVGGAILGMAGITRKSL